MNTTSTTTRRTYGAAVLIALIALGLAGCGTTGGVAASSTVQPAIAVTCGPGTTGTVEYANGSVAPPYHYSWDLHFTDRSGTMALQGGYEVEPAARWTRTFDLTAEQATALCVVVKNAAEGSDPVTGPAAPGSSSARVTLSAASGAQLDRVLGARPERAGHAADLLPEGVWEGLDAKFQAWSAAQR